MKYEAFRNMMDLLRNQVRLFCKGGMPTPEQIESLGVLLGVMAYNTFGARKDEKMFIAGVKKFVQNEVLRVCT